MKFRKNWKKYQKRKAIRAEASRRMDVARAEGNREAWASAMLVYCETHSKIKRYYDRVPMNQWWSFS